MKINLKDYALVTLGCLISSIGLNGFMAANNIVSGGLGGLGVSMNKLFGWDAGDFTLIANALMMVLCYFFLGKATFFSTLYGAWVFPLFIKLTATIPSLTDNQLLGAVFGGIIMGIGLGLVFMGNSSTGGTSIPTKILHNYTPLSLGMAMTIVDGLVVLTGFWAFDMDSVLHSIIALLVISYVINIMMTGFQSSNNLMIISEKSQAIKQGISEAANRGVTEIPIYGGYTGHEKRMLMVTALSIEVPAIEHIVQAIDPTAFIIIMPATQVHGRGFSLTKHFEIVDEDILPPI